MSNQVIELNHPEMVRRPETVRQTENVFQNSVQAGWGSTDVIDDFDYVPVSPWGPIALAFGVMALSGFVGMFGLYVALTGTVLGIVAVSQIRAAQGTVKGGMFAWSGLVLSFLSLTLGSTKMAYAYSTECPEGFIRVNFPNDISDKQFLYTPRRQLHPDVVPLVGQRIFLKGFMWLTQKSEGLTEFILLKDNGECCFGGKAQPYDMMMIKLPEGETTKGYIGMVSVAGVLSVNLNAGEDDAVYTIDASLVEEARTGF